MTDLLLRRAAEIAPGVPQAATTLLIVGHGTALNDKSAVAAKREVEKIARARMITPRFKTPIWRKRR